MKGYLGNEDANKEAFKKGWFHTGDLAVVHEDGYIELKDRSKDIIISGGENISSIEIEKIILKILTFRIALSLELSIKNGGSALCNYRKKIINLTKEELIKHCRKNLAGFKMPKKVIFSTFPRTSTGKIQKFNLRKLAKKHNAKI